MYGYLINRGLLHGAGSRLQYIRRPKLHLSQIIEQFTEEPLVLQSFPSYVRVLHGGTPSSVHMVVADIAYILTYQRESLAVL